MVSSEMNANEPTYYNLETEVWSKAPKKIVKIYTGHNY